MIDKTTPMAETGEAQLAYQGVQLLIKAKKYDLAIMALEKVVERYPDFAPAQNDLGVLNYNQDHKEKALTYYEKAAALDPDNIVFQKNLADYYHVELNRTEEAMQIYLDVLKRNPEDIETLLAIGNICITAERLAEAKSFYNRVLEIEPWNSKAWQTLQAIK
jgi:tetratricopeptide (TPR) repeat protein